MEKFSNRKDEYHQQYEQSFDGKINTQFERETKSVSSVGGRNERENHLYILERRVSINRCGFADRLHRF